jgi:hypothetical protein
MIDFTCECDVSERRCYRVHAHDGAVTICAYCVACAEIATDDDECSDIAEIVLLCADLDCVISDGHDGMHITYRGVVYPVDLG